MYSCLSSDVISPVTRLGSSSAVDKFGCMVALSAWPCYPIRGPYLHIPRIASTTTQSVYNKVRHSHPSSFWALFGIGRL